jgi:hypothetical protein
MAMSEGLVLKGTGAALSTTAIDFRRLFAGLGLASQVHVLVKLPRLGELWRLDLYVRRVQRMHSMSAGSCSRFADTFAHSPWMSEHSSSPRPCQLSIAQAMVFASSWTESMHLWRCSLVVPDGAVWTDMLSSGIEASVLNIMPCCIIGISRLRAEGAAGDPGESKGLVGAREIAAIVSANVLLVSERSLFESARTRRLASSACNSSLVLESCQHQSQELHRGSRTLLAVPPQ